MATIEFWSTLTRCSLTRFRAVWPSSSSCGRNRNIPQYLLYMRFQCIVPHCFTPSITGRLWTYTVVKMFGMLQIRGWGGHIGILQQFLFQYRHSVFKIGWGRRLCRVGRSMFGGSVLGRIVGRFGQGWSGWGQQRHQMRMVRIFGMFRMTVFVFMVDGMVLF